MPELSNPQHEAFVRAVIAGNNAGDAYKSAGYEVEQQNVARAAGNRLLSRNDVKARLEELRCPVIAEAKKLAEFTATYQHHIQEKAKRLASYEADFDAICELQAARAADPDNQDVPGIRTGLLAVSREMVGKQEYKIAKYDAALIKSKLDVRRQMAIEIGEWSEKQDVTMQFDMKRLTPDQWEKFKEYQRELSIAAFGGDEAKFEAFRMKALEGIPTQAVTQ